MKLKLEHQKIHFRLSQNEYEDLCAGGTLNLATHFPNNSSLCIDIFIEDITSTFTLEGGLENLILRVNKADAYSLRDQLPSRADLRETLHLDNQTPVEIILDVDIRTQKK